MPPVPPKITTRTFWKKTELPAKISPAFHNVSLLHIRASCYYETAANIFAYYITIILLVFNAIFNSTCIQKTSANVFFGLNFFMIIVFFCKKHTI